jgi:SAM-dependent methyltransferase
MGAVDVAGVEDLASTAGRALTDEATAALDAGEDLLAVATRLRAGHGTGPGLVALALTQAGLRRRARVKFGGLADRLIWTQAGLEQATRTSVARHRAARLALAEPQRVADLCCGIGGDLLELAAAGLDVVGFDLDPVTVAVASRNLDTLGLGDRARVAATDVRTLLDADLAGFDAAFVDPARRSAGGRRTFDPDAYTPPFAFVLDLAGRLPATAAKVAPGIPHALVPAGTEAEWVSDQGQVKEAALWFGPLAGLRGPARRRATLLPGAATVVDQPGLGAPAVGPPGRWLHEPDGAVIRAGLVAEVAATIEGRLLDRTIAYVSTDADVVSPFTRRYQVDAVLPFQLKRLRAALRELGAGDVVVKKRGSALDPEDLRRRLRLRGGGPTMTVLLTRLAGEQVAVLARPAPR